MPKQKTRTEKEISLPTKISLGGMALLWGLTERGASTLIDLLELKHSRMGMAGALEKGARGKSFWDYYRELKELKENSARTILWRLQKKGLVEKKENRYRLTFLGLNFVKKSQEKNLEKPWDDKWRIIMFDIPEKRRKDRNWLRAQLINLEYKLLQESVFIGKQPLEENLFKELINRNLYQYIRLLTVGEIDNETELV